MGIPEGANQSDIEDNGHEPSQEVSKELWMGPAPGEVVTVKTSPGVEGVVLSRSLVGGKAWLRLLIPPYRWGGIWTQPEVATMEPSALPRPKRGAEYKFPFAELVSEDIRRGVVDAVWMADLFKKMNARVLALSGAQLPPVSPKTTPKEQITATQPHKEAIGVASSSSLSSSSTSRGSGVNNNSMNIRSESSNILNLPEESIDYEEKSQRKREKKKKQRKSKKNRKSGKSSSSSSESSDTSSSAESSEEGSSEEVRGELRRDRRKPKYIMKCRFRRSDKRGRQKIEWKLEGDVDRRKWHRRALEEIYSEAYTMELFVERIIQKSMNTGTFRPFVMEVSWLRHTAKQIDRVLLDSLHGPWAEWNAPVLDDLMTVLLELCVRVAPNHEYPMMFSDTLRKWMKKRRIGANEQIGPVAPIWQHATFSDLGLVAEKQHRYGGNDGYRNSATRSQQQNFRTKYGGQGQTNNFRREEPRRPDIQGGDTGSQNRQKGGLATGQQN